MSAAARALLLSLAVAVPAAASPEPPAAAGAPPAEAARPIDLATTLRLAGANAVEVRIAEERLHAARASATIAKTQLLPSLSLGASWRGHGGLIQDVAGNVVTASKEAYTVGPSLLAQADVGEAIFRALAARQTANAAAQVLASQRQQALLRAARAYLDLLVAQAAIAAARDALDVARDYEQQLHRAVEAGIALKGDELRVRVQARRSELALEQALEQRRVTVARLAELLRLGPTLDLAGRDDELVPLSVPAADEPAASLVAEATAARPELIEAAAELRAAAETARAARLGPLVPSLAVQAFAGRLGGGRDEQPWQAGSSRDYVATLAWRIGPGGLLDAGRTRLAEARRAEAQWSLERLKDAVGREVVEAQARTQSRQRQLASARAALESAREGLELARQRRQFEVGVVLENVLALEDDARARQDLARALGEYAKAQYDLLYALGQLTGPALNAAPATPPAAAR
jgi:outer membrane protein